MRFLAQEQVMLGCFAFGTRCSRAGGEASASGAESY